MCWITWVLMNESIKVCVFYRVFEWKYISFFGRKLIMIYIYIYIYIIYIYIYIYISIYIYIYRFECVIYLRLGSRANLKYSIRKLPEYVNAYSLLQKMKSSKQILKNTEYLKINLEWCVTRHVEVKAFYDR